MEWGLGGRMGGGSFLGWYGMGGGKIQFILLRIQKKIDKNLEIFTKL